VVRDRKGGEIPVRVAGELHVLEAAVQTSSTRS
jgi:hypothetical protein